jgi:sugar porter (SP) family MFS transporter
MLAIVFVVGALWCALAPNPVLLSVGRLVLGFAVGGATQTAPMYVAELAPPKYRGRLVLCFQIAIGVGIVIATIVSASESIPWRVSIGAAAVPAAIMLGLLLRLPESPRWLVKQGERDKARDVLDRVRPSGYDVDGELDEMAALAHEEKTAKTRGWSGLRQRWVRPALILGCGIAIFTQLSGIEMIIYYSPTILTDNGFSTAVALQVSVALGVSYLVAQLVGLTIIGKVGRRRLTLIMIPGAALSLFVLGALFVTGNSGRESVPFIIACLVVFMLFNAGGLQLMGWPTGSETYPSGGSARGHGCAVRGAMGHQPIHHADPADADQRNRRGPGDVAVRIVQCRSLALRVLPDAGPHRPQPGGDRRQAQRRRVPPSRLRSVIRAEPIDCTPELRASGPTPMSFHS